MKKIIPLFLLVFAGLIVAQDVPQKEKEELIKFYHALNGNQWKTKTFWTTNNPVSQWDGVLVEKVGGEDHVTQIRLVDNNISGDVNLNLPYLIKLDLQRNQIKQLKVNSNRLMGIYLNDNAISNVDLSQAKALSEINLAHNNLDKIDLASLNQLAILDLSNNNLNELDLSNITSLVHVNLNHNYINDFKIGKSPQLKLLDLGNNNLSKFDARKVSNIETLLLDNNNIKKLSLENMPSLRLLSANQNKVLAEVTFNNVPELALLSLNDNNLTLIDLTKLEALNGLEMNHNPLNKEVLNLSQNKALEYVSLENTQVNLLNMNHIKRDLDAHISDKVKCIAIDNPKVYPNWSITWLDGFDNNFKDDCSSYLSTKDVEATKDGLKVISPVKENLIILSDKNVREIEIYSTTGQLVKKLFGTNRNISELAKGLYILKVQTDKDVYISKFLKK